jgi:hypothetical protein
LATARHPCGFLGLLREGGADGGGAHGALLDAACAFLLRMKCMRQRCQLA